MRLALASLIFAIGCPAFAAEPEPKAINGKITCVPPANPESIPLPFRLDKHTFPFELKPKFDLPHSGVEVLTLTFPSPVKTATEANNTVHCEYFRPKSPGKHPAVIVLDILDGKQLVSRSQ